MPTTISVKKNKSFYRALVTPVCDTAAYASGDVMGGKLEINLSSFGSNRAFEIDNIQMHDKSGQVKPMDLLIFDADPSASTFTDNGAIAIHATDKPKLVAVVEGGAFVAVTSTKAIWRSAAKTGIRVLPTAKKLFLVLVSRGTVADLVAADDISIGLDILPMAA